MTNEPPPHAYPQPTAYPTPAAYPSPAQTVGTPGPQRGLGKPAIVAIATAAVAFLGLVGWLIFPSANDNALSEAIRGTWNCSWGPTDHFVMEVGDGTFVLRPDGGEEELGSWSITDGVLTFEGLFDLPMIKIDVPATVPDRQDLVLVMAGDSLPGTLTVTDDGDHFKFAMREDEYDYVECDR